MILLDAIELPEEMIWQDEFEWATVKANVKRTIQGKHIVRESQVPDNAGREITLTSNDAWATRAEVTILRDLTDELLRVFTLTMHDNRTYQCRFRHWDVPCFAAESVLPLAFPDDDTYYNITMKLAIVE